MPVTILGQHISTIRSSLGHRCIVYKSERPYIRYRKRPKTITHSPHKFKELCEMYRRMYCDDKV